MRTTLRLDDDVAAEVERLRRRDGVGRSEAVNRLIRDGPSRPRATRRDVHEAREIGRRMDVSNIAEVLEYR